MCDSVCFNSQSFCNASMINGTNSANIFIEQVKFSENFPTKIDNK